jgi:hypothetical protein
VLIFQKKLRACPILPLSGGFMMMRWFVCLWAVMLAVFLAPVAPAQTEKALVVTNGDFSNLEGLSPLQQQQGWYSGVPLGWSAAPPPEKEGGFFAVRDMGAAGFVANLHVLSRIKPEFHAFKQEVGVLGEMSDVTLTFDTIGVREEEFSVGAAIVNAHGQNEVERVLSKKNYQATGAQRLVAAKVPAGARVVIQFWAVKGYPGIGNVTIQVTPSS